MRYFEIWTFALLFKDEALYVFLAHIVTILPGNVRLKYAIFRTEKAEQS